MNKSKDNLSESGLPFRTLVIGALGVVYGDIGTSPLYALRQCFSGEKSFAVDPLNIYGALSLILWTLTIIVCFEYMLIVLRADNRGEGGILALMTLILHDRKIPRWLQNGFIFLGLFGAAMLYGDGMLTPAVSVLSAVEGLNVATVFFKPYVVPISLIILVILFLFQYRGTEKVGSVFGPVMLLWFFILGLLGLSSIVKTPEILYALNPYYAFEFFQHHGLQGATILGATFLAVTGVETIYTDMGHFGKSPIRTGWFKLVFIGLLLNYLGQGAHLLKHPQEVENLFYRIAPDWALYPLVIMATLATVIASQAVISGAFSMTRQAVQLGFFPRLDIEHTSNIKIGQVYIPVINALLLFGIVVLILVFKESGNLASAYGISVSCTMVITSFFISFAAYYVWHIRLLYILPVAVFFLSIDLSYFVSNALKFFSGGWIPIMVAGVVFYLMRIWKEGRNVLRMNLENQTLGVDLFLNDVAATRPTRVPGVAVFLTGNPSGIPRTLLHNFKHNKILHEQIILLTVKTEEVPYIEEEERAEFEELGYGFNRVSVKYGFSEDPNIPKILKQLEREGLKFDPMKTTYFLGRETLIIADKTGMTKWRKKIFSFLSHNAFDATQFFRIPPNAVVELGIQVRL